MRAATGDSALDTGLPRAPAPQTRPASATWGWGRRPSLARQKGLLRKAPCCPSSLLRKGHAVRCPQLSRARRRPSAFPPVKSHHGAGFVEWAGKGPRAVFQPVPNQPDEAKSWGHQGKRPGGPGPGKEGQNHARLPELDVSLLLSGPCPLLPPITEGAGVLTRTHPGGREGCGLPDGLPGPLERHLGGLISDLRSLLSSALPGFPHEGRR